MGGSHTHDADPGGLSPTGGEANHGEATKVTDEWGMGVLPNSGGAKGGGDRVVIGIHQTQSEHGGALNFHLANFGALPGSEEALGGQGREMVVGVGRPAVRGRLGAADMEVGNRRSRHSLRGKATRGCGG